MRHLPSHRESFNSYRPVEDRRRRLDGQRTKTAALILRLGRGGGRAGDYGMACRAGHRVSIGTMKEAAN
jgi:hypothetical protein